jgi:hypothetical protein
MSLKGLGYQTKAMGYLSRDRKGAVVWTGNRSLLYGRSSFLSTTENNP